jgi:hypothetical protein
MNKYTTKEIDRLLEICPYELSLEREAEIIRSIGTGLDCNFSPGSPVQEKKIFILYSKDGPDLSSKYPWNGTTISYSEKEIYGMICNSSKMQKKVDDGRKNGVSVLYQDLNHLKEFLFDTPHDQVPLYVNKYPTLVKWRLEINK